MKRDLDLIREILLTIENHPGSGAPRPFRVDGRAEDEVGYHCALAWEEGLITGPKPLRKDDGSRFTVPTGLTPKGHDFLDLSRPTDTWTTVKKKVAAAGTPTLKFAWEMLLQEAAKKVGAILS